MAVRTATRRWPDLGTFLREYPSTLRVGALVLPSDALDGEPAAEMKVDLVLPFVGRVGPVDAQVIARLPDGGAALRIPEMPDAVKDAIKQVMGVVDVVKEHLLTTKKVVEASAAASMVEVEALRARVAELEAQLAQAASARPTVVADGLLDAPAASAAPSSTKPLRGFQLPDLQGAAPAIEGALGDTSLRDVLLVLAGEKATGLLTVQVPSADGTVRTRWGFWSKGGPVGWRTEPLEESEVLGVLLWRAGRITREQLEATLALMDARGIRQGEALVELGLIPFGEVVVYLQRQADYVFQRVLAEREGVWSFHPLEQLPEKFLAPPVRTVGVMFRAMLAAAKDMPAEDIAMALRPSSSHYFTITPAGEALLADIKLTSDEQKFFAIARKAPYRLRDLFTSSNLPRAATAALCWALTEFGIVEFQLAPGMSSASAPATPASPAPNAAAARTPDDLDVLVKRMGTGTLFEQLGVHWICTPADVAAAFAQLEGALGPDAARARWGDAHLATVASTLAKARVAFATLSEDAKRRAYRQELVGEATVHATAGLLGKKGQDALARAARDEAVACFARAAELMPGAGHDASLRRAEALPR